MLYSLSDRKSMRVLMFSTITHESLSLAVPTHDVRKTRPGFTGDPVTDARSRVFLTHSRFGSDDACALTPRTPHRCAAPAAGSGTAPALRRHASADGRAAPCAALHAPDV
jgi:hypothetical protein